jgi:hypothetical protein
VPENSPVQGWPFDGRSIEASQQGLGDRGEDRHMMVVDPVNGLVYEFYRAFRRPGGWEADVEATFDLKSNKLRPKNWTSGDAAGLSMFAALPRYDECERGLVTHALRFTVARTRRAFIYRRPITPAAATPRRPAMGQRFRLKASVDVSGFPQHAQAIALGLKKYGMFVADNGADWDFCVPPDSRLKGSRRSGSSRERLRGDRHDGGDRPGSLRLQRRAAAFCRRSATARPSPTVSGSGTMMTSTPDSSARLSDA